MPSSSSLVTEVRFKPARGRMASSGLLGWVRFRLGPLCLDGIALRRSKNGRPYLAFPEHRTPMGAFPYMTPTDGAARQEVERGVLEALGFDREARP